jgi:hypothetical protein
VADVPAGARARNSFTTLAYMLSEDVPVVRRDLFADFEAMPHARRDGAVHALLAVAADCYFYVRLGSVEEAVNGMHTACRPAALSS